MLLLALSRNARAGSTSDNGVDSRIFALGQAVAKAEGFFVTGALPQRRNNPGDLTGAGGVVSTYATAADGWLDLYDYLERMLTGQHAAYWPEMTWRQAAEVYTGRDNAEAWARIVCGDIGVSPDSTLGEYFP